MGQHSSSRSVDQVKSSQVLCVMVQLDLEQAEAASSAWWATKRTRHSLARQAPIELAATWELAAQTHQHHDCPSHVTQWLTSANSCPKILRIRDAFSAIEKPLEPRLSKLEVGEPRRAGSRSPQEDDLAQVSGILQLMQSRRVASIVGSAEKEVVGHLDVDSEVGLDCFVRTLRREASVDCHGGEGRVAEPDSETREIIRSATILTCEMLRQTGLVPVYGLCQLQ